MTVRWEPYLGITLQPVTPRDLSQLEEEWGVSLPEDYKSLVTAHQGMTPEPCVFDVGKGASVFNVLLTIKPQEGREVYSVRRIHEVLKPLVPEGIFPFAETPGGESICFDYRTRPKDPPIVLVTVETFIYPIADTFKAFMDKLHD
ncbi:MAG: SMI1/KNR4 family protein [Myxococcaceae bacterium]|nr:SMI1/KNR4 family protein [Myxococcaceae bacterium]